MSYVVSITDQQILTAVRNWLVSAMTGEVVQGYANRVSTPTGGYVTMSGLLKTRLGSNEVTFSLPTFPDIVGTEIDTQSYDYHIQLDAYGDDSADWASILNIAYHSQTAFLFFRSQFPGIAPLYMEEPKLVPVVTGEEQYELRWTMVIHLQFKPSISNAQQSATNVVAGLKNVEAVYPG